MKLIPNSKDYYVSEQGEIYRGNRKLGCNRESYIDVRISFINGTSKNFYVHRLVAMVYLPNPENKPFVNHKDGNKKNNAVSNLEWVTAKENTRHAVETGLCKSSTESPNAKLNAEQVHEICRLLQEGYRVVDIKNKFNICQSNVSLIKCGRYYKDISSQYTFPPKKRSLSESTVRWVCEQLAQGKRHNEIMKNCTSATLNRGMIDSILHRCAYKDISKDYTF